MTSGEKWERIEDVPEGVEVVSKDGFRFIGCEEGRTLSVVHEHYNKFAPFTRVEGEL